MPLIVITGLPCVGKTSFANQLESYLSSKDHKVILINEESLGISKVEGYLNEFNEKKTRAALRSAVDHSLTAETFVILDSLNYIKGFRYEIYCISRTQRTPHCMLWVHSPLKASFEWNSSRSGEGYAEDVLLELRRRYEQPSVKNRWDSPLFNICWHAEDSMLSAESAVNSSSAGDEGQVVADEPKKSSWRKKTSRLTTDSTAGSTAGSTDVVLVQPSDSPQALSISGSYIAASVASTDMLNPIEYVIYIMAVNNPTEYLSTAAAPKPNSSTIPIPHATADMLYELDAVSQDVVALIVQHQRDCNEGTPLILRSYSRSLELHRLVSLGELQRHRRLFVKVNSQHPPTSSVEIGASFIDFLALQL